MNSRSKRPRTCKTCSQSFHMTADEIKRHAELCASGRGIERPSLVIAQSLPQQSKPLSDPRLRRIAKELMVGKR